MRKLFFFVVAAAALSPSLTATASDCSTFPGPIYISGINPPFLVALAEQLIAAKITLVYVGTNDCGGLKNLLPPASGGTLAGGVAAIWDTSGDVSTCDLPIPGVSVDIAITGLFPETCAASLGVTLPQNLEDVQGPVVPYELVTPVGTGAPTAISAEQAYYVYGYGFYGGITPWDVGNQQSLSFDFAAHQAPVDIISGAIGVLPASMLATMVNGNTNMLTALNSASPAISAIGMLSSDVYDGSRTQLSALAFRGYGQDFAWLPDSNGGFDKRNVREGRYVMSAPMHFLALTADGGQAETDGGQTILDLVNGTSTLAPDLAALTTTTHLIPQCAMQYGRAQDGYDPVTHYGLVPNTRTQSCDCYFDSLTSSTSCASCASTPCSGGTVCRRNYCEAF